MSIQKRLNTMGLQKLFPNTPFWQHDCKCCEHLLTEEVVTEDGPGMVDFYICQGAGYPTMLARFSEEGSEYYSCPTSILDSIVAHKSPTHLMLDRMIQVWQALG